MVQCGVCPHACNVHPESLGVCGARSAEDGRSVSLNYGKATALALDPIEKKPLMHFHPGSMILSYGSYGCNLSCPFCQNSDIARMRGWSPEGCRDISPDKLVEKALQLQDRGNIGIAFTYNEPLVSPEYVRDTAKIARKKGLVNVVVTNGYTNETTLTDLLPYIDAFNIDLKSYSEEAYKKLGAPGGLKTVKRSIELVAKSKAHLEVTTLVVPGFSDNPDNFEEQCSWLASLDPQIPLHISRFFPAYKMKDTPPTKIKLMQEFGRIARTHLTHVHAGNMG